MNKDKGKIIETSQILIQTKARQWLIITRIKVLTTWVLTKATPILIIIEAQDHLKTEFKMKDLGKTKFCLGLQLEHLPTSILVHQSAYV
jgi:hypothetical protein